MKYTADFETTTKLDDCRVWGWGACNIDNTDEFLTGTDINSFFEWVQSLAYEGKNTIYFHNLKFDGEFILYWLFENGYRHVTDRRDLQTGCFTSIISDKGMFYQIKICFYKNGKHSKIIEILDSLKILPFKVSQIAKAFNLPIVKGEIDYSKNRSVGYIPNINEILYIKNDVTIVAMALHTLFSQGLTKMTQGSNALFDYKRTIGQKEFERIYPAPRYDADIRQSYKGGFTYLAPQYAGIELGEMIGLDVNSLYPFVMATKPLPYGEGIPFFDKYEPDKLYPLYVQLISCQFKLKKNHIPTIQIKGSRFIDTEYLTDSGMENVELCLTNLDIELLFKHYDVYNVQYLGGWKFLQSTESFRPYIEKWYKIKAESKLNGNAGMYTLAKLMQNALYGKMATSPFGKSKYPVYEDGFVKYKIGAREERNAVYIPAGSFITSWARYTTINAAQANYDRFVYSDTDSLYLLGTDLPTNINIDNTELGAWAYEKEIKRAKFLRQKSYILECREPGTGEYHINITCAGMPETCYPYLTWETFQKGTKVPGKLQARRVKGGVVLVDTDFTFKG